MSKSTPIKPSCKQSAAWALARPAMTRLYAFIVLYGAYDVVNALSIRIGREYYSLFTITSRIRMMRSVSQS
jgi:hypothetical protein